MPKEDIKEIIAESKRKLQEDYDNSAKSIKDNLTSFKKKAMDQI